jgi:hypothetical protein
MGRREIFQAVAASLAVFALLSTVQKLASTPQPNVTNRGGGVPYPTHQHNLLVDDLHPTPSPTAAPSEGEAAATDHPRMVAPAPVPAPKTPGQPETPLTEAYCKQKYSARTFIDPPATTNPPVLWTFPGSGNTWARLLIESATGNACPYSRLGDDKMMGTVAHAANVVSFAARLLHGLGVQ